MRAIRRFQILAAPLGLKSKYRAGFLLLDTPCWAHGGSDTSRLDDSLKPCYAQVLDFLKNWGFNAYTLLAGAAMGYQTTLASEHQEETAYFRVVFIAGEMRCSNELTHNPEAKKRKQHGVACACTETPHMSASHGGL